MASNYKSYKSDVLKAITNAEKLALAEIGFLVEAEAKLRTPVLSGTLKRSITSVVDNSDKSVVIGTNVEYASYVEKGTSRQKAKPYLTPAAEDSKDLIQNIIEKHLKKEVR